MFGRGSIGLIWSYLVLVLVVFGVPWCSVLVLLVYCGFLGVWVLVLLVCLLFLVVGVGLVGFLWCSRCPGLGGIGFIWFSPCYWLLVLVLLVFLIGLALLSDTARNHKLCPSYASVLAAGHKIQSSCCLGSFCNGVMFVIGMLMFRRARALMIMFGWFVLGGRGEGGGACEGHAPTEWLSWGANPRRHSAPRGDLLREAPPSQCVRVLGFPLC